MFGPTAFSWFRSCQLSRLGQLGWPRKSRSEEGSVQLFPGFYTNALELGPLRNCACYRERLFLCRYLRVYTVYVRSLPFTVRYLFLGQFPSY